MRYRLLGATEVTAEDGSPIVIGAPKRRALLAALALEPNRALSAERLIDLLWGEDPPPAAVESLHAHVSRLRRDLGDGALMRTSAGYLLRAVPEDIDVHAFEAQVQTARRHIAGGSWREASTILGAALDLWRGPALADVPDAAFASQAAARLDDLRQSALEDRIDADLALGRHAEILPELEALTAATPLRERFWGQLMTALYRVGRQADALAAYRQVRRLLRDELGIDPSAPLQELEIRILRQDPTLAAGAAVQPIVRLPVPLTPILGRAELLDQSTSLLAAGRLVSLVGPGGVGKTRLSIAIGEALIPKQAGGVVFVDLSSVRDPGLVLSRIGEVTGGGDQPGEVIGDAAMLLILDNFEQVIEAARHVVRLLEGCRNLRVLVTSRAPLHVRGEAIVDVPSLSADAASQLFVERAQAAMASAMLDPGLVDEIVRRLDGLPLALELAAARTRLLAPNLLREGLADRLALLVGGMRDAPDRHQTLRDTIAWSYELLGPSRRTVFRSLSVLAGDFDLAAAAAVGATDAQGIGDLFDQSLLRRIGDRFAMLDSIHAFAAEEAERHGETESARDRHLAHYLQQTTEEGMPRRPEETRRDAWTSFVRSERVNLTLAFEWAMERGNDAAAWQIFHTLGMHFVLVGAIEEGASLVARALPVARRLGAQQELSALAIAAEFPRYSGQLELGLERKREALDLARRSGSPHRLATTLDDTACILGELGQFEEAERLLDEALAVRRTFPDDDPLAAAHTWGTAAEVAFRAGRLADAEQRMAEVETIESVGLAGPTWIVETEHLKGRIDLAAGRHTSARRRFEQVVREGLPIEFRAMVANGLDGLAMVHREQDARLAAELVGMADRVRAEARAPVWDPAARGHLLAALAESLGEEELGRLRVEGHALSMASIPGRLDAVPIGV